MEGHHPNSCRARARYPTKGSPIGCIGVEESIPGWFVGFITEGGISAAVPLTLDVQKNEIGLVIIRSVVCSRRSGDEEDVGLKAALRTGGISAYLEGIMYEIRLAD